MGTKEERAKRRESYAKTAVTGGSLLLAWIGLKPMLNGDPLLIKGDAVGHLAVDAFQFIDNIPW